MDLPDGWTVDDNILDADLAPEGLFVDCDGAPDPPAPDEVAA